MASNNTVELVVKVTDQASGPLNQLSGTLAGLGKSLLAVGFTAALTGIAAVGLAFRKVYEESTLAELSTVRFRAAFDALGAGIHVPREELEKFAIAAQKSTRFSSEQVKEAQTTLLRFGDVTGEVFRRAQGLTLDLAEAMGGDAASAAQFLGRSLENPIQSMRLLRQVGVYLSESQQTLVKGFIASGNQMQAQKIILDELEKRYGGLAEKIGNTTVGAIAELGNAFDDLFQVPDKLSPLNDAIRKMADVLKDPLLIKNVHEIFAAIVTSAGAALEWVIKLNNAFINLQLRLANIGAPVSALEQFKKDLAATEYKITQYRPDAAVRVTLEAYANTLRQYIQILQNKQDVASIQEIDPSSLVQRNDAYNGKTQGDLDKIKAAAAAARAAAFTKRMTDLTDALKENYDAQTKVTEATDKAVLSLDLQTDAASTLNEVLNTTDKMLDKVFKDQTYSKQQLQAIQNIQNAFVTMFHSVDGGIKGMLKAFLNALKEMLIQAAAAQLASALFGPIDEKSGKRSGGSSFDNAVVKTIGSFFGFASGGDAPAGLKLVGENGPEIISSGPARIWNAQQLAFAGAGGGGNAVHYAPVTQINVEGSMDAVTEKRIYSYIEAGRAKDQRELVRTLQRNGVRHVR